MAATVQAEALRPGVPAEELRDALDAVTDADALEAAAQAGEAERDQILAVLDGRDGTA
jgi:hypothetical protein